MITTAQHPKTKDDFFLMSNLSPKSTQLPFVVWISPRGNARHDIRVKVSRSHKAKPGELVVVAVRPQVRVLRGELPAAELRMLRRWIELNLEPLVRFWNGDIEYTEEMLAQLRPLPAAAR